MIKIKYEKPLKRLDKVIFYVNDITLTATVYSSYAFASISYYLYFDNGHSRAVDILTNYFKDSLFNVFEQIAPLIYDSPWPHSTRKNLEKILDNISIFDEF